MRTTLMIDDALFRELKRRAAEQKRTLSQVTQEALCRGRPLTAEQAFAFLEPILSSDVVTMLEATPRHTTLLRMTIRELGRPSGNVVHDLHTAVLMREHGITEIMTRTPISGGSRCAMRTSA